MSSVPSIKDIYIAERLTKLKDNINDDHDNFPLPSPPPSPSMPPGCFSPRGRAKSNDDDDNNDGKDLTPTQRFLLNQAQQERIAIAVGESGATTSMPLQVKPHKVKFSEKLNKVFPEANDIFESDYQLSILEKEEITVPNIQTMIKELNEGKVPENWFFFSVEEKENNLLKTHALKIVGILSKSSTEFLEYLASKYGNDVLQKSKFKIHLESSEIYQDNINTKESLYSFLQAQEDVSKKFDNLDINLRGGFEYYIREVLDGVINDKNDVHTNSTSKFLFYRFNNFRQWNGLSNFAIRHTIISDDNYALETIQSKNWLYFVKTILEVSNDNVELSSVTDQYKIDFIQETF